MAEVSQPPAKDFPAERRFTAQRSDECTPERHPIVVDGIHSAKGAGLEEGEGDGRVDRVGAHDDRVLETDRTDTLKPLPVIAEVTKVEKHKRRQREPALIDIPYAPQRYAEFEAADQTEEIGRANDDDLGGQGELSRASLLAVRGVRVCYRFLRTRAH
jgi:hypothetical protein